VPRGRICLRPHGGFQGVFRGSEIKMSEKNIFTGRVESLSFSGGVLRFEGRPFFVPFTCPGDVVRVEVGEEKAHTARLSALVEASPCRVEPLCPLFGVCGGCAWQHISYERQLEEKKRIVSDSFERIGGFAPPPGMTIAPSAPYGYRNRVSLHTDGGVIGFKPVKSAGVVPVADCPAAVPAVREFIKTATAGKGRFSGRFTVYGFDDRIAVEGGDTEKLFVPGLGITMDVRLFFQSNLEMQRKLIGDVCALAGEGETLADIYCGVGAFAYPLAAYFQNMLLVEENPQAIALARENLRGTPAKKEYCALRVEQYCAAYAKQTKVPHWDAVIVDPPRGGLCAPLIDLFCRARPSKIIYVSCNPVTLARDAKRLLADGFRLASAACYDFYPQTTHVECAALFTPEP
jgi:23S rRNA (uracil1939-C5)-methyltransferase